MYFTTIFTNALALATFCGAVPVARQISVVSDAQILQFALTLEHLENAFYTQALSQFSNQSFTDAGLPWDTYGRFQQISEHEATHVQFLTKTLQDMGETPTQACNYSFPYDDPKSFAKLSEIFEGVGAAAYLGSASLVQNKTLLTASGAILATEARQNAWVASYINGGYPWSSPFETPLSASFAYSLAKPFINASSCPSSNPQLPITDFPTLTVHTQNITAGSQINVTFTPNITSTSSDGTWYGPSDYYLALMKGLDTHFVILQPQNGTNASTSAEDVVYFATLPVNLTGSVYAFVSTVNASEVTDEQTVTGAALLQLPLPADADNSN